MDNNNKVYVKKSNIENADNGLFAKKKIKKNKKIVRFNGILYENKNTNNEIKSQRSNIHFEDGYTLVCPDDDLASFANDCIKIPDHIIILSEILPKKESFFEKHPNADVNASIFLEHDNHTAYLVAKKNINKNEEIFVHYGPYYWIIKCLELGLIGDVTNKIKYDPIWKYPSFIEYFKYFYSDLKMISYNEKKNEILLDFTDGKHILMNSPDINFKMKKIYI